MFNKIFSLTALLLTMPILLIISFMIIFNDGFPIFFSQQRVGKNGKMFKIFKFRTMVKNAEEILKENKNLYKEYVDNGYKIEVNRDPRILPFGAFLRSSSLDELPQFLNVLFGDMNVVGPRPVVEKELDTLYGDKKNIYLAMKPGVTGLWQVSGRSNVKDSERVNLDIKYYKNKSLINDIKIIFKTVIEVINRTGAY
ncbi:MAG: multidrug MFS transporter [Candidatus Pelagibacter sp. TMED273]|nr:MAG: multidrug MFS transporter [Candidatus Pelagibacter sp. TMED273]